MSYFSEYRQRNRELLREKQRLYREAHRDELRAKQAAYHAAHPEQVRAWQSANRPRVASYARKRRYGITEDEYQELLGRQGGVCALCGRPETAVGRTRLAVDHDHATDRLRGLLCIGCNISLGYYERGWRSRLDSIVVDQYLKGAAMTSDDIRNELSEDEIPNDEVTPSDDVRNELAARDDLITPRRWIKVDSWHIVATIQNAENMWRVETLCGLKLANVGEPVEKRPRKDKTCENCYRLEDQS